MLKKRKRYLVTADKSEAFACSLVTSPAMEETFVAFKEDTPLIEKFADEKKHMITGVVAIPNKPIYRRNADGEEYDIIFSAEAIEKMAKDYLKDYRQHEVTLQHEENADGVYLVEQWIKNDMVYDKSLSMGLSKELPVGSWFQTYYVDSNDVWQRIQDGELLGFSLECALSMEEMDFNKIEENKNNIVDMDEEMLFKKIKKAIKEIFVKKDEDVDVSDDANKVEHLAAMSGLTVEDYKNEVDAVKEELEDETPAPTVEETPNEATETPSEPSKVDEPITTPSEENKPSEEPKEEPTDNVKHLEDLLENVRSEVEALKEINKELTSKIKQLEKEPSVKPVNINAKPNAGDGNGAAFSNWLNTMREMVG